MTEDLIKIYLRNHLSVFYIPILIVGLILWISVFVRGYPDSDDIVLGFVLLSISAIFFIKQNIFYKKLLNQKIEKLFSPILKIIFYKIFYMVPWFLVLFWPYQTGYMFDFTIGFVFIFFTIGAYVALSSSYFVLFLFDVFLQIIAASVILLLNKNSIETPYILSGLALFSAYAFFIGHKLYNSYKSQVLTNIQLAQAAKDAKNANMAKSDFLSMISHEIRTPMHGIISTVEHLSETNLNKEQEKSLNVVMRCSETLLNMLNDVLDISKIEANKIEVENIDFNLHDLAKDCIDIMKFSAVDKDIDLSLNIDQNVPSEINTDRVKLQQVIINFLNNAIKFTENGSVTLKLKYITSNNVIRVEVVDTGIGISQENQKKLFDRFVQADNSVVREYGGTGLGLAIAKSFITLMDGQIGVDSEQAQGSTFWAEIPYVATFEALKPEDQGRASTLDLKTDISILVAEDNKINQKSIERILVDTGYSFKIVSNGEEVLKELEHKIYNLILMDINMPILDGIETTKKIKQNSKISKIPILGLTASTDEQLIAKFYDAGIESHINKPFRKRELLEAFSTYFLNEAPSKNPIAQKIEEMKEDFGEEFCFSFVKDSLKEIERLLSGSEVAFKEENYDLLYQLIHDLCAVSGNIGMDKTFKAAKELELICQDGHRGTVKKAYETVLNIVSDEMSYIEKQYLSN